MAESELSQLRTEVDGMNQKMDTVCFAILELTTRVNSLEAGLKSASTSAQEPAPTRTPVPQDQPRSSPSETEVAGMNRKVDAVSSAILELTTRVNSLEAGLKSASTSAQEPAPTRTSGYVNWGWRHDVIKTQCWVILTTIKGYIRQLERSSWDSWKVKENLVMLPTSNDVKAIAENKRFPQDGVYVDINSPRVSAELTELQCHNFSRPGTDLLKRFDEICRTDIHTFSSFEEHYQLKWV